MHSCASTLASQGAVCVCVTGKSHGVGWPCRHPTCAFGMAAMLLMETFNLEAWQKFLSKRTSLPRSCGLWRKQTRVEFEVNLPKPIVAQKCGFGFNFFSLLILFLDLCFWNLDSGFRISAFSILVVHNTAQPTPSS